MDGEEDSTPELRHYFVDEAGDAVLFNRRKQIIIGTEGCAKFFIVGLLDVADPDQFSADMDDLRRKLLSDPYLKQVPSMQPHNRKTSLLFHAKDDCPEVRAQVFPLIMQHDVRFFGVVREKRVIAERIREFQATKNPAYRYHPDQLYDRCVSRLFRDRLHRDQGYVIHFAKRGNRNRTNALKRQLEHARANFRRRHGISTTAPIEIVPDRAEDSASLQAADYFLWALQRLYERGEERYWEYVVGGASLVHDVDDTRNKDYGEYYTKENRIAREKCRREKPGI